MYVIEFETGMDIRFVAPACRQRSGGDVVGVTRPEDARKFQLAGDVHCEVAALRSRHGDRFTAVPFVPENPAANSI